MVGRCHGRKEGREGPGWKILTIDAVLLETLALQQNILSILVFCIPVSTQSKKMNDKEAFAIAVEEAKLSYKEGGVPVITPLSTTANL